MPLLPLLLACAPAPEDSAAPDEGAWDEVATVIEANCASCHQPGGLSFDLTEPELARSMAPALAAAVSEGRMPPWSARDTEDCATPRPWQGDRRLSPEDIDLIVSWSDAGAPLPPDPRRPAPGDDPALDGEVDEARPPQPYASAGGQDEFACFVADAGLSEDLWIDGLEVAPQNMAIAHHALVYADTSGEAEALGGADGWYDCSRGVNVPGARFMATWVPGSGPTLAPEGTAMRLEAGTRFVVQMHYHPSGAVGAEDLPAVRFREAAGAPERELYNSLLGNARTEVGGLLPGPNDRGAPEFFIPARAAGHTEEMVTELGRNLPELSIVSVGAHMHLVGTRMEVWVERAEAEAGEPDVECLMPVQGYDYDWQQLYYYDQPVDQTPKVRGGDTIRLRCTYDNTLDNPGVVRALEDVGLGEPVDVTLGEGTLDEMCILMVGFAI